MAPHTITALSPSELSYLHDSLSLRPPIRPDARLPKQFRPLHAETSLLPSTNGSARICFSDGTEAIVGIKCEVQRIVSPSQSTTLSLQQPPSHPDQTASHSGEDDRIEVSIEIPGQRDDDPMPVFLGHMIKEALVVDGSLTQALEINRRWGWRVFVDVRRPHVSPLCFNPVNPYD
jgi:exosome complex component RRP42